MSTTPPSVLPGRLGHPEYELRTDPRADPRMVTALAPYGVDQLAAPSPVSPDDPIRTRLAYLAEAEAAFEGLFAALMDNLPPVPGFTTPPRRPRVPTGATCRSTSTAPRAWTARCRGSCTSTAAA